MLICSSWRPEENELPNASPTRPCTGDGDSSQSVTRPETPRHHVSHVLPRAVPRHEVAPGPQPEDVQHADVLTPVL